MSTDQTLINLIKQAKKENWEGKNSHILLKDFLPKKLYPLSQEFQNTPKEDILTTAWLHLNNKKILQTNNPWAWLATCTRNSLRRSEIANRNQVSENLIQSGRIKTIKENLGLSTQDYLFLPLDLRNIPNNNPPNPTKTETISPTTIAIYEILINQNWQKPIINQTLEFFENQLQTNTLKPKTYKQKLTSLQIPKDLANIFIKFIFMPRGFVWAIAQGIPISEAILFPQVKKIIPQLDWNKHKK